MSVSEKIKDSVLELFNLQPDEIKSFDISSDKDATTIVDIELLNRKPPCPHCHMDRIHNKEIVIKNINHAVLSDRKCILRYHAHRYTCLSCGRTFFEHNPFVFKAQKISVLTVKNILEDLRNPAETFSNIAKRYHLSPTSVASIFDEHVQMERLPLPRYLCVDEVYSFKKEDSKYVCMFVNFETGDPIDVLPSRRKEVLLEYFMSIPQKERENVLLVGMDMWDTYRDVAKAVFPNSLCVADHYHIIQEMNRKIDKVRIRLMKSFPTDSAEYYLLKHFNWMIFKDPDITDRDGKLLFDPNRSKRFNHKLKLELNYYEILDLILSIDQELTESINLKNRCVNFYKHSTYQKAEQDLKYLIRCFKSSSILEMREFGNTLSKWKYEVINSFIVVDHSYTVDYRDGHVVSHPIKINSAIMERQNSTVKTIKKVTMGMTNWDRFRNRVLYAIRRDSTYFLNPIDTPKARRAYKPTERKKTVTAQS